MQLMRRARTDDVKQAMCSRHHAGRQRAAENEQRKPCSSRSHAYRAPGTTNGTECTDAMGQRATSDGQQTTRPTRSPKYTPRSSVDMTAATCARKAGRHRGRTSSSFLAAAGACAGPHHSEPHALARACVRACVRARAQALRRACARAWLRTACGRQQCRRQRAADVVGDMQQTPCRRGECGAANVQQTPCKRQYICQGWRSRWQSHACARRCAGTSSFLLATAASCTMRTLRQLVPVRACFARVCACACAARACVARQYPSDLQHVTDWGSKGIPRPPPHPHTLPLPATAGCAQSRCRCAQPGASAVRRHDAACRAASAHLRRCGVP